MVTYTHNTSLMLVAILVSIVAAFTGLALTNNIVQLPERTRKALVTMSSVVIGGGIWTMHFVAMLANEFSVPVGYDVVYTLGSGLVSILLVCVALLILHYSTRTSMVLSLAGLILGFGIISMHFIGMSAIRGATPEYSYGALFLTVLAAAITGVCAIRIAYGKRSKEHIVAGGLMLGMSVVVVHYTAMSGTTYQVSSGSGIGTIAIANSTLAIVLVLAVFVLCGAFLLVATTFLTTPGNRAPASQFVAAVPSQQTAGNATYGVADKAVNSSVDSTADISADADKGDGVKPVEPIDIAETAQIIEDGNSEFEFPAGQVRIPYERNKKILFVDSSEVAAIRADGRYTQLYTLQGICFSPWSITEAENRLLGTQFYRSHRSYLINVQVLTSFEKRKDSGVCLFDGFEQISSVPVSRTRVFGLMELLGLA